MDADEIRSWIGVIGSVSALIVGLVTALWAYAKFVVERGLLPPSQFEVECIPVGTLKGRTLLEILLHIENVGTSTLVASDIRIDVKYLNRTDTPTNFKTMDGRFGRVNFSESILKDLAATPPTYPAKRSRRRLKRTRDLLQRCRPLKWMKRVFTTTLERLRELKAPQWITHQLTNVRHALFEPNPEKEHVKEPEKKPKSSRGIRVVPYDTFVQSRVNQTYTFTTAVPESASYVLVWSSFRYAQRPRALQRSVLWLSRKLGLVQFTLRHVREPHTIERVFNIEPEAAEPATALAIPEVTSEDS
jgi:hypothetical protein